MTVLKYNPYLVCLQTEDIYVIINVNKIVSEDSFTWT